MMRWISRGCSACCVLQKQVRQNTCVLWYNETFKVSLTVTLGGSMIFHTGPASEGVEFQGF